MASAQQQLQIYQQWFGIADLDKDGGIAGSEAVSFFQRSGLDQMTLGQVWEMSSAGAPKLNPGQFASAMRLVALAQANGGRLPIDQARVVVAGMGPPLPLARMAGLEQPAAAPPSVAQPTGYAAQPTGYAQQYTGPRPAPAPAYAPQPTGQSYAAQSTGASVGAAVAAGPTVAASFPPATPTDMQRYQAAFMQLDGDRDGLVQGSDCFTYFMQWGLDKGVLRHIWEIVAGNSSALNQQQLTSCLYLMDAAKRGIRPPTQLPPGPFPPVAQQWSLQSQFGGASVATAGPAASQQAMVVPSMPALGPKFTEPEQGETAAQQRPSQVPNFGTSIIGSLALDQREKLAAELKEATDREGRLFTIEDKAAQTKARAAAFNAALQEVMVFKSRTDVALLQAQDQVARLEEELVVTRAKYDKAYAAAQTQGEAARKVRENLGKLMADKTESEGRLLQLEGEIAAANAVTPADVQRMEAEVQALHARIKEQEAIRDSKSSVLAGIRQQKTVLEGRLAEVDAARNSAEAEIRDAQKQVSDLQASITSARAEGGAAALAPLVSKAAELYRNLYTTLVKAGHAVPFDCLPSNLGLAAWMDEAMSGMTDWNDLDDESRGFVLVNALPGQRIEASVRRSKAVAAAANHPPQATGSPVVPMQTDGFGDEAAFGMQPPPAGNNAALMNNNHALPANAGPAPSMLSAPAALAFRKSDMPSEPSIGMPASTPSVPVPLSAGFNDNAFGALAGSVIKPPVAAVAPAIASSAPVLPTTMSGQATSTAAFGFDDNAF